jgi:hypothetical protein
MGCLVIWDCGARFFTGPGGDILPLLNRKEIQIISVKLGDHFYSSQAFFLSMPHFWLDAFWFELLLQIILLACGICVAIGLHTKRSLFLCWLLTISLHTRDPLVLYGGDHILRLILFWLLFLPCDTHFSLGTRRLAMSVQCNRSILCIGLITQVLLIYLFTALHKSGADWRTDGTALERALTIRSLNTDFGEFVALHTPLFILRQLTTAALILEEVGPPLLVLLPPNHFLRLVIVTVMILFHLSLALVFHLCYFQAVMIALWCAFLPSSFWNGIHRVMNPSCTTANPLQKSENSSSSEWNRCNNTLSFIIALYCIFWNFFTLPLPLSLPGTLFAPGYFLRIDQHWGLFAPNVQTEDGWLFAVGETLDGSNLTIDAYGDAVIADALDKDIEQMQRSRFWRELHMSLFFGRYPAAISAYANWLNMQWNSRHPNAPLKNLKLYFMLVNSRFPKQKQGPVLITPG